MTQHTAPYPLDERITDALREAATILWASKGDLDLADALDDATRNWEDRNDVDALVGALLRAVPGGLLFGALHAREQAQMLWDAAELVRYPVATLTPNLESLRALIEEDAVARGTDPLTVAVEQLGKRITEGDNLRAMHREITRQRNAASAQADYANALLGKLDGRIADVERVMCRIEGWQSALARRVADGDSVSGALRTLAQWDAADEREQGKMVQSDCDGSCQHYEDVLQARRDGGPDPAPCSACIPDNTTTEG